MFVRVYMLKVLGTAFVGEKKYLGKARRHRQGVFSVFTYTFEEPLLFVASPKRLRQARRPRCGSSKSTDFYDFPLSVTSFHYLPLIAANCRQSPLIATVLC